MKKIITIILITILAITGIYAYGGYQRMNSNNYGTNEYQNQLYEIAENGSYQDLVDLREDTGMTYMRWVQSDDDFNTWQEMHEENEESGISNYNHMQRGYGYRHGGCMFN